MMHWSWGIQLKILLSSLATTYKPTMLSFLVSKVTVEVNEWFLMHEKENNEARLTPHAQNWS